MRVFCLSRGVIVKIDIEQSWNVEISLESVENFVNSLLRFHCQYMDLLFVRWKRQKLQFDLFEIMKQMIQLYHLHMNEPKTFYLCYCQSNTLLDFPLLAWCLFFFALLFWWYFPMFLDTSASTKSENFASFRILNHTNPKSFPRYFGNCNCMAAYSVGFKLCAVCVARKADIFIWFDVM